MTGKITLLPPAAILFASEHPAVGYSERFLEHLQLNLAQSAFSNIPYLMDCIALFSEGILKYADGIAVREIVIDQPELTSLSPAEVPNIRHYLLVLASRFLDRADDHSMTTARIIWACGWEKWHEIRWIPRIDSCRFDGGVLERFGAILTSPKGFVTSVTFKTKGDALIHNILKVLHLAPWQSCLLRDNEAPYAFIARAYGAGTNDVVRQYLDANVDTFLRPSREIPNAVVFLGVAALLQEAGGNAVHVCVNRDMIKREHTTPAMFITTECPENPGRPAFGYIYNETATIIADPHEAILEYLYAAKDHVDDLKALCTAIFDPNNMVPGCSFGKYAFSDGTGA